MTNYNYGELHLSPVWKGRDFKTGRFLKGHTPANKGKKWNEFKDKRSQKRSAKGWKNLEPFRCKGGGPNSGRPKKAVIAVMDNGGVENLLIYGSCCGVCRWEKRKCSSVLPSKCKSWKEYRPSV